MTTRRRITRVTDGTVTDRADDLAVEAPLTIALESTALVTTMRTPGADLDLAAGWLVAESDVFRASDIVAMGAFSADSDNADEVDTVRVALAPHVKPPEPRSFLTSSACGVCSSRLVRAVPQPRAVLHTPGWSVSAQTLLDVPERMRGQQRAFDRTGGLHAAAIADADGEVIIVREDVGRHNAVDKVIGHCLIEHRVPLTDHLLVVSGRVSFEITQKALAACVAGIVAVSAPSSLAVDLAREHGMLLVGLSRGSSMNIYSRSDLVGSPTRQADDNFVNRVDSTSPRPNVHPGAVPIR